MTWKIMKKNKQEINKRKKNDKETHVEERHNKATTCL